MAVCVQVFLFSKEMFFLKHVFALHSTVLQKLSHKPDILVYKYCIQMSYTCLFTQIGRVIWVSLRGQRIYNNLLD